MKLFLRIMLVANVCICLLFQLNANPNEFKQKNYFIENKGQWDDNVRFLARLNGMNAWITDNGVVYDFYTFADGKDNYELPITNYDLLGDLGLGARGLGLGNDDSRKGHVVKMSFQHREKLSESLELSESYPQQFVGINKSETYYNYFIGNDKSKWSSNVSLYEEVLIKNVYAGIDFRFYFENGMLRYDLNISPFADLNKIKMKFEGQESLGINDNGELVIGTSIGNVNHQQLYAWQEDKDKKINCNFRIDENGLVGFGANDYKKEMALVIDPLVYSTYLGGTGGQYDWDLPNSMAVDYFGNVYLTGLTKSADFPRTPGAYNEHAQLQNEDVFISKLSFDGSFLYFSTFLGGNSGDWGNDIALDGGYSVYITGIVQSENFPVTAGAFDTSYNKSNYKADGFVCKLSGDGTQLLYSTILGGYKMDNGETIVIDKEKNAYITGYTQSEDFPTTSGAFNTILNKLNDSTDIFVCKLSADGSQLLYSTFLGGSNYDWASGTAIDNLNNLYITGSTSSNDFPTSSGVFQENFNGIYNTFVSKLNSDGTELVYSTFIGGSNNYGGDIALDSDNNAYVTGVTDTIDFPTTDGAFNRQFNGFRDSYILKLSGDGKDILYSTLLGGNDSSNQVNNIAIDNYGDVYVSGRVSSANFPTTIFAYDDSFNGLTDIFVCKFNSTLSTLLYSTYLGGNDREWAGGMGIDHENNIYVAGATYSKDFPVTEGVLSTTFNGGLSDMFISKIRIDCDIRGFDYPNFQYTDNFNFVKDAKAENNALVLTTSEAWQKGAVWYKEKVPIKKGFITTFSFRISEGVNDFDHEQYPGADGIAFVIQNYSPDAIGSSGGGIGYSGIPNSLAVEFDTYKNDGEGDNDLNDKDENHYHLFCNGTLPNTSDHSASIPFNNGMIEDSLLIQIPNGREIFGKIEYEVGKSFKGIYVRICSTPNFEKDSSSAFGWIGYIDIPLDFDSEEFAWIGFTSATGNAYEKHEILSWSFCPTPTNAVLVAVEENEIISDNINNTLEIFPNPAFDLLNIEYSIANAGNVSLEIFDVLGNKIKVVDYGFVESGRHHVILSLSKDEQTGLSYFPSGMYYLVLRNNEKSVYGKFGVMK